MEADRGDLTDEALREEIELVGELVVAATASPGRMAQSEVDSVLGVPAEWRARDGAPQRQPTATGSGSNPLNPAVV